MKKVIFKRWPTFWREREKKIEICLVYFKNCSFLGQKHETPENDI